jgi:chromosome segregation ATPase
MFAWPVNTPNARTPTQPRRVLAVGDIALTIEMSLGAENIEVAASGGGHDAARRLRADRAFDLVVVSGVLADMSAYDFVASMLKHMPGLRAMVVGAGLSAEQTRALTSTGVVTFTETVESALAVIAPHAPSAPRGARSADAPFEQSYSEVFDRIVDEARQVQAPSATPTQAPRGPAGVNVESLVAERNALLAEVQANRPQLERVAQESVAMRQRVDALETALRVKTEELTAIAASAQHLSQERDAWKRESESRRQHVEGLSAQLQTLVEIRARLERDLASTQDLLAEAELARENIAERTRVEARDVESATRDAETASGSALEAQRSAVSELHDRVGELQAALDAAHVKNGALEEAHRSEHEARVRTDGELRLLRDERLTLDERLRDLSERADVALKVPELERTVADLRVGLAARDERSAELSQAVQTLEKKLAESSAALVASKRSLGEEHEKRVALEEQVTLLDQQAREHGEWRARLESEHEKSIAELEQAFKDIAVLERERDAASTVSADIENVRLALTDAERRAASVEKALLDERAQHKETRRAVEERSRERDEATANVARERAARDALERQVAALEGSSAAALDDARAHAAADLAAAQKAHDETRATVDGLQGKLSVADANAASLVGELQVALRALASRDDSEKLLQNELDRSEAAARDAAARAQALEEKLASVNARGATTAGLVGELEALRAEVVALRAVRAPPSAGAKAEANASDLSSTIELLSGRVLSLQEEKLVLEKMCDDLRDMLRAANEELLKSISAPAPPRTSPTTRPAPSQDPLAPVETRIAHEMPKAALAERARFLEQKSGDEPPGFDSLPAEQAETTRVGVTLPDHLREDSIDVDLFSMEERGDGGST